jgi:hypothetical protein
MVDAAFTTLTTQRLVLRRFRPALMLSRSWLILARWLLYRWQGLQVSPAPPQRSHRSPDLIHHGRSRDKLGRCMASTGKMMNTLR